MVVEDGAALRVEFQPEARHVSLHSGDGDRRIFAGPEARLPDMRPCQRSPQQHGADTQTGQHHRGRRLLAVIAVAPPLCDFENYCRQAESGQRHRERQQRRTAELRDRQ
jgi:hypothetical protein